jgi:hypothetical protein
MDKRLNKKIETYTTALKDNVRNKITELNFEDKSKINDLLQYLYDYERLTLVKDDLIKRKRIKNSIPSINRCNAKRANGEQCTRRRKDSCEFCGTHAKGVPHGLAQDSNAENTFSHKVEVTAVDICGIVYYVDTMNNVYNTEEIMEGKSDPSVIAKYVLENGIYSIPGFGI